MDGFDGDRYAFHCKDFPYYSFQSHEEWELASFLLCLDLSMKKLDEFFNLNIVSPFITFSCSYFNESQVKKLSLSFMSAKTLHSLAEMLPSGPRWKHKIWETWYPTKDVVCLYYWDPIKCIQSLLESPISKDHIKYKPFRLFETAKWIMRVYTEWLSGEVAWAMQVGQDIFFMS